MTDEEVFKTCLTQLMADIEEADEFPRPPLAHYCSISTLESILKSKQIWLSNPLYMNDLEEVRFGINTGMEITFSNISLKNKLGSPAREKLFFHAMSSRYGIFANEHAFNLYVTCFTEHHVHEGDDGRLSMWRAYGANGDGAALVFDINPVSRPNGDYNGLFIGQVRYGTTQERRNWLETRVEETAKFIQDQQLPDSQLPFAAVALFERIKIMAIFSKHRGFSEEREWRLVYLNDQDLGKVCEQHLGYHLTPRGIEPKLKLPIHGTVNWHSEQLDVTTLIQKIILGPSVSSPLAKHSISRMLDVVELESLRDKLVASTIPLRPPAQWIH